MNIVFIDEKENKLIYIESSNNIYKSFYINSDDCMSFLKNLNDNVLYVTSAKTIHSSNIFNWISSNVNTDNITKETHYSENTNKKQYYYRAKTKGSLCLKLKNGEVFKFSGPMDFKPVEMFDKNFMDMCDDFSVALNNNLLEKIDEYDAERIRKEYKDKQNNINSKKSKDIINKSVRDYMDGEDDSESDGDSDDDRIHIDLTDDMDDDYMDEISSNLEIIKKS